MPVNKFSGKTVIKGGTDGTDIGNTGDKLKTTSLITNTTPIPVDGNLQTTAFGELSTLAVDPVLSLEAATGLKTREVEIFTNGTGAVAGVVDNGPGREFRVACGTDVGGYGVLRTKKTLRYRPGIGSLARFTGKFDTPVANSIQRIGFFNLGNELTFGYDGTQFGILRKTGGRPEIRDLVISVASNQNTTATVTIDGVVYTPSITNASAEQNAYEIATGANYLGWNVINVGNHVIFQSEQTAVQNGTYSATASGNFTASFTTIQSGGPGTEDWTYQANWSETTLTTGDDPFIFDPSKGNVFEIQFQYLGYGQLKFRIENPNTGEFVLIHRIEYTNQFVTPSLDIPHMKLGLISASAGSTTNLNVCSASMAGFNESTADYPLNILAAGGDVKGISTADEVILAVRKNTTRTTGHLLDPNDVQLQNLTVAADASKPVFFDVLLNPTFSNPTLWQKAGEGTISTVTDIGTLTDRGLLLYSVTISKSSNLSVSLKELDVILSNNDIVAVVARTTAGAADVAASLVWGEK